METKCKTCNHEPICAYCAEHLEEFSLPAENGACDLYDPRPEKCACESCREPDPDESARLSSPFYKTVEGMLSPDYKERFKAEYQQTKIRYDKVHAMLVKADAGKLEFEPTCPLDLLRHQAQAMGQYLYCLEVRAQMEGVELK